MAQINRISNQTGQLTVDPGASGDSFVQFNINTTGEFRIGVDDTDDSFRVSQGSALGTNDAFVITSAGFATKPLQPAVVAAMAGTYNDVTGDGTLYTLPWDTTLVDRASNFNTGTFTFTAPITGLYRIILSPWSSQVSSTSFNTMYVQIVTSNRTYTGNRRNAYVIAGDHTQATYPLSVLADMDASDTIVGKISIGGGGKTVDIWTVGTVNPRGWFAVSLIC